MKNLKFIGPKDTFEKIIAQDTPGVAEGLSRSGRETKDLVKEQKGRVAEMREADKVKSKQLAAKIVSELEAEIERLRRQREEQLRARRQAPEPKVTPPKPQPLQERPLKKRRGIIGGFWGRRAQRAREQAQPEMVGRRVGG